MALPMVADSLAGRMETLTLLPLSQSEIHGSKANWVDNAFAGHLLTATQPFLGNELIETVLRGGYPEAVFRSSTRRRAVWSRQYINSRLNRVVKTPKIQFVDSGLLSTLANVTPTLAQKNRHCFGNVLECFVYGELRKHMATAESDCQLFYYRDHDQYEVDFLIENAAGNLVGVEVKAAATVTVGDLRGLKRLSSVAGEQLKMCVILYDGSETLPLGDGFWAAPLSSLWGR